MFGMKPPVAPPEIELVAVVVRGEKVFRENLPPKAWNVGIMDIFTPQNIAIICKESHE